MGVNSTDQEKNGRTCSLVVNARVIPLSFVTNGANSHNSYLLGANLGAIVFHRAASGNGQIETLCADTAYIGFLAQATSRLHQYQLNVKTRRQESKRPRPRTDGPRTGADPN